MEELYQLCESSDIIIEEEVLDEAFASDILSGLGLSKDDLKNPDKLEKALKDVKKLPKDEKTHKIIQQLIKSALKWGVIGGIGGLVGGVAVFVFHLTPLILIATNYAVMIGGALNGARSDYKTLIDECERAKKKLEQAMDKEENSSEKAKIKKSIADLDKSINILRKEGRNNIKPSIYTESGWLGDIVE